MCDQQLDRTGKMTNAFTSAAIVQEVYFDELGDTQCNNVQSVDSYMFGDEDYECVKKFYVNFFSTGSCLETLAHFLGMTDVDSTPQASTFNHNNAEAENQKWLKHVVGLFVDN